MNDNQDPQFSDDNQESEVNLEESFQSLITQLNETPRRKSSISFLIYWFCGNQDVLLSLVNIVLFGVPVFFTLLALFSGVKNSMEWDWGWFLGILCWIILCFALLYPYWKAYFLFKNGYFTLGHATERGLLYKDASGTEHCWTPKVYSGISQPFTDYTHRQADLCLVVIGKRNPRKLVIMDAYPLLDNDGCLGFVIYMNLYSINVLYSLDRKKFIDKSPCLWKWIIPAGMILWTFYWVWLVFFRA